MSGRTLSWIVLGRAAALAIGALVPGLAPALFAILVLEAGFGAMDPLLHARMSEGARAEHRATVLSLRSVSFTFGSAIGLVTLGLAVFLNL